MQIKRLKIIRNLATCEFVRKKENVAFIGPPGTGKTHLATAILDSFVHHCHFVVIKGKIYRMKQREGTLRAMSESSSDIASSE